MASSLKVSKPFVVARPSPRNVRVVPRATWQALTTMDELNANKGRVVATAADNSKILVQEFDGAVYAVSNRCTHLNLPLQGKIVGKPLSNGCVVCPFHGTAYDVVTGQVKGDWSPGMNLPFVGKVNNVEKPLPTYETRVKAGVVEVLA